MAIWTGLAVVENCRINGRRLASVSYLSSFATNATMVLQPNFAKRIASNVENTPPSVRPKSLASRVFNHRRRARPSGSSSKFAAGQAARRSCKHRNHAKQLRFKVASIPPPDVKIAEASSSKVVTFSRELQKPEFREVSREALLAADPSFEEADPSFIREALESIGRHCLQSLASVCVEKVPENIPPEIDIKLSPIEGFSHTNPTHMLAIFGQEPAVSSSASSPEKKRKVTLYPVHSIYLAAHCASLPPFAPSASTSADVAAGESFKIPVRSICLPCPDAFQRLSNFLYTKDASVLLSSLLPMTPPANIISSPSSDSEPLPRAEHRTLVSAFAYQIASTYTTQILVQHAVAVRGFWQNTCALGIHDEMLWEALEVAWLVILAAIAVGTGSGIDTVLGEESV
ncbi:hypothetical protein H0H92_002817 [Tricholoma furcatifolium]|nr:hypothetical protein H0H92_002817 [Tricholoma furcatifolium]